MRYLISFKFIQLFSLEDNASLFNLPDLLFSTRQCTRCVFVQGERQLLVFERPDKGRWVSTVFFEPLIRFYG